jgi:hypothetical protein
MMQNSWTMNATSSFDALVATASAVGATVRHPPSSPQHCKCATSSHGDYLVDGGAADEYSSPTCVFAASFDSMAAYEEQQQHYKDSATIEHKMARISLTRSDSQLSLTVEDCYDQELMMSCYAITNTSSLSPSSIPQPPPQVRRTTSISRSSGRTMSTSLLHRRPSDPVARFLLSK